ncbi:MAG TPA: AI-2E family transporter [Pseudomonadales bacterium]|nr:AI-2E family transporter [Pseudomonadales bacterium]
MSSQPFFLLDAKHIRFAVFIVTALLVLGAIHLELLVSIYAGFLTYASVMVISERLVRRGGRLQDSKIIGIMVVALVVVLFFVGAGTAIHFMFRNGSDLRDLMVKMSDILASARSWLPADLHEMLPEQEEMLTHAVGWLRSHARDIETAGLGTVKALGLAILGIILGSMVAVSDATRVSELGPVSTQLLAQVTALRQSFWRVATAQLRISALNTSLTAIYLVVVLPLFGVHLPFAKTLIAVTFVAGLLPVIGNLISNTVICTISLSVNFDVMLSSLAFLVIIHKLEYFVNARIVGTQINVRAWEILLCMLFMERLFGVAGVVAAPVLYAWFKSEWTIWDSAEHPENG